jgi:hypothetical protein
MMERYKGYWITGSAGSGPPYTRYWESRGCILKDGRGGPSWNRGEFEMVESRSTWPGSPSGTG